MFQRNIDYSCAVFGYGNVLDALQWLSCYRGECEFVNIVVPLRSTKKHNEILMELDKKSWINVVAVKEPGRLHGPVLCAYLNPEAVGEVLRNTGITALAVLQTAYTYKTFAEEVSAEVLAGCVERIDGIPEEPPLVSDVRARLVRITSAINHTNSIAARGYEKTCVVKSFLELHDAGFALPVKRIEEWALAHGWNGKNIAALGEYAREIKKGKRPRLN